MESKREVWEERVAGWRRSGLTAKQYASSIGVKWGTLSHWAWQLGKTGRQRRGRRTRAAEAKAAPPVLIEVVGRGDGGEDRFELQLPDGRRLHIPARFEAAALRQLLDLLQGER